MSRAGQRFLAACLSILVLVVLVTLGWSASHHRGSSAVGEPLPAPTGGAPSGTPTPPVATPTPTPTNQDAVFTIVAAGDVLPHDAVLSDARTGSGYDFTKELAGLDPWVQGADLALCHMEVPVAPPGEKLSTYPVFGAPASVARDLAQQGWDGCSNASNHSVDRGFPGIVATLNAFDADGLGHAGTGRTQKEATSPQLYRLERGGQTITGAHLSATFGLNGLPMPAGKPWAVELIDTDAIVAQAKAARAAGADLVIASIHDGTEYVTKPTADQDRVMDALAASGEIDFVIGAHAHVPQPIAKLPGGVGGRGMWVAYGVGNMLSNQSSACCVAQTENGLFLTVTVTKAPGGAAHVTTFEWTPLTVDTSGGHKVYAIPDVLSSGVGKLSHAELVKRLQLVRDAVGTQAPERTSPATPTGEPPVVVPHPGAPTS